MVDLEAEFWRAIRFARAADERKLTLPLGLSSLTQWGLAWVETWGPERRRYEPIEGGALVVVAPVVEGGDLIDLAAIDPITQHVSLRLGYGRGLGLDALEKARVRCCALHLVERPLDWLRFPFASDVATRSRALAVYLFDLHEVAVVLDRVDEVNFASIALADRVRCLLPPSQRAET